MKHLFLLLSCFLCLTSFAQTSLPYAVWEDPNTNIYHFVSIDPATGTKTNINTIPGMTGLVVPNTTVVNTDSNWFIFKGLDGGLGIIKMYVLDIATGNMLYSNPSPNNLFGFEYNCADDTLYALHESLNNYSLVWVDPTTANHTVIGSLPTVSAHVGATFTLDHTKGEYNFMGFVGAQLTYFNLDITNGAILNSNNFNNNVVAQRLNCNTGTIYGIWEDAFADYHLVTINPVTGVFTSAGVLTNVDGTISESFSINSQTGTYTFRGFQGANQRLFTVDLNTANILYNVAYTTNTAGMVEGNCCFGPPVADFYADTVNIFIGDTVNFFDSTLNNPIGWTWTFNGGLPPTSTMQNPVGIQYNSVGCFDVELIASNNQGIDTVEKTCYINVMGIPPIANFGADTMLIATGGVVNYMDSSLNTPTSWAWTFSGGNPATSSNPSPTNIQYDSSGCYDVQLIVMNAFGSDTMTKTCYISVNDPPTADFSASFVSILVGDGVDFTDLSTNSPTSWSWTFSGANPGSSNIQNPMNINYDTAGCWDVELTVTNQFGSDTELKTCYIDVIEPAFPVADFVADDTMIVQGETVNFTDLTTNGPTAWNWTFTGGTPDTSDQQNPTNIQYDSVGCFEVTLAAINNFGSDVHLKTCYISVTEDVGIDKKALEKNIKVFPNPFGDQVNLEISSNVSSAQFVLTDVLGRVRMKRTIISSGIHQIDTEQLDRGLYLYTVQDAEGASVSGTLVKK